MRPIFTVGCVAAGLDENPFASVCDGRFQLKRPDALEVPNRTRQLRHAIECCTLSSPLAAPSCINEFCGSDVELRRTLRNALVPSRGGRYGPGTLRRIPVRAEAFADRARDRCPTRSDITPARGASSEPIDYSDVLSKHPVAYRLPLRCLPTRIKNNKEHDKRGGTMRRSLSVRPSIVATLPPPSRSDKKVSLAMRRLRIASWLQSVPNTNRTEPPVHEQHHQPRRRSASDVPE
jgi:hypothetical protein